MAFSSASLSDVEEDLCSSLSSSDSLPELSYSESESSSLELSPELLLSGPEDFSLSESSFIVMTVAPAGNTKGPGA